MSDITKIFIGDVPVKFKDMGDGTFALVTAFTADSPVELTGDVLVDTFGALNDAKELDPDAASATLPSLARGQLHLLSSLAAKIGNVDDAPWNGTDEEASLISIMKAVALNTAPEE